MICPKCGYAMDAFDKECPRCHGKGVTPPAPPQQIVPAISPSASTHRWSPGSVQFDPATPERIREVAQQELRGRIKAQGNTLGLAGCATIGWMPFVGCLALFIPVVGIFICIVLWGLSGVLALFSGGSFVAAQALPVSQDELIGLMHTYRNMCEGQCPICGKAITIMPFGDTAQLNCPVCKGNLIYESGLVKAI